MRGFKSRPQMLLGVKKTNSKAAWIDELLTGEHNSPYFAHSCFAEGIFQCLISIQR